MNQAMVPSYRYMSETDIEISRDIEINSNPVPWTEKNFLDCLRKDYYCLVQEVDQEFSGFAIQTLSLDQSHLLNIGIKEKFITRLNSLDIVSDLSISLISLSA